MGRDVPLPLVIVQHYNVAISIPNIKQAIAEKIPRVIYPKVKSPPMLGESTFSNAQNAAPM